mmetsp:Transcript_19970/g.45893  ORF Transcript_19970/g.45893 Transcript_19970/m.45893 type:complete len:108 (-) Transcript_19970:243-566(-)
MKTEQSLDSLFGLAHGAARRVRTCNAYRRQDAAASGENLNPIFMSTLGTSRPVPALNLALVIAPPRARERAMLAAQYASGVAIVMGAHWNERHAPPSNTCCGVFLEI